MTILTTKLHAPRLQPGIVERERIMRMLDEIPQRRLTLISASAGFGKTTAIAAWLQRSGWSAAWLSLDAGDNDLFGFLGYLVAALQTVHSELGRGVAQTLEHGDRPSAEVLLGALINDLTEIDRQILLVLDDYHVIERSEIHDAVLFLIEHLPEQLRVLMTSRSDPSFPIARLRVRKQLLEIRAADLRFTPEEAAELYAQTLPTPLTAEQSEALVQKTEGWAAGLQMAGLSLRSRQNVNEFIEAFTGADRFVLDYLLEEVLGGLPSGTQRMMLKLAVLDRFNGPLCDAVTGFTDGAVMLEQLEEANLFLVPLDNRREWYRYHKLFGDLLLHRLQQTAGHEVPELHRRAALWFEAEGAVVDAIEHARRSGDRDFLRELVERNWILLLRDGGDGNLSAIERSLSREEVLASPRVAMALAWMEYTQRRFESLDETLDAAERLRVLEPGASDLADLLAQATMLRAVKARDIGDNATTIELVERVLRTMPSRPARSPEYLWYMSEGMVLTVLGCAYDQTRDYDRAELKYLEAIRYGRAAGDGMCEVAALSNLGRMQMRLGDMDGALRTAGELEAHKGQPEYAQVGIRAVPHQIRARAAFERNDLELARAEIAAAMELAEPIGQHLEYHRIQFALHDHVGDVEGMRRILASFERLSVPPGSARMAAIAPTLRATLALRTGDLSSCEHALASIEPWVAAIESGVADDVDERDLVLVVAARLVHVRMLMVRGESAAGLTVIERMLGWFTDVEMTPIVVELLVRRALAQEALRDIDAATASLVEAVGKAASQRLLRSFAAEPDGVSRILRPLMAKRGALRGVPAAFVRALSEVCNLDAPQEAVAAASLDEYQLTAREEEILRLLALGYTNQKIADKLYVSINTIKTHLSNLFDKLGVSSRVEALAKFTLRSSGE